MINRWYQHILIGILCLMVYSCSCTTGLKEDANTYKQSDVHGKLSILKGVLERDRAQILDFVSDLGATEEEKRFIDRSLSVVDFRNRSDPLEVHQASVEGYVEALLLFIALGADVNAMDEYNRTALHYAKNKEIASVLVALGADIDAFDIRECTPLRQAVLYTRIDVAEYLLQEGADVNAPEYKYGETPLHTAVLLKKPDIRMVKILLDNGADINALCCGSSTAIDYARMFGHKKIELLLIEYGARDSENE